MAGAASLTVVASPEDEGAWWSSNVQEIVIRARPAVVGVLVPTSERISSPRDYDAVVRLRNKGNTELRGELKVSPGAVPVDVPERHFVLSPGGRPCDVPVTLTVPGRRPWSDRVLSVPIDVEFTRSDLERPVDPFVLHQYGLRSDLPLLVAHFAHAARHWATRSDERTRWALVVWGVVLLVAGLLTGGLLAAPSDAGSNVKTAMPEPSASTTSTPPTTSSGPEFTASMKEKEYCAPGASVVFMASMTNEEARDHGQWLLAYETSRLAWLAKKYTDVPLHPIQAGRRGEVCDVALELHAPDEKFQVFLWIGPLRAAEADAMCELIRKPGGYDCVSVRTK